MLIEQTFIYKERTAMVKFVALYRMPEDVDAFEERFREGHIPLVRELPNLQRIEVGRSIWPGKGAPYYLMAELSFEDGAAFQEAITSDAGASAAADVMEFVPADAVTMFAVEVTEE